MNIHYEENSLTAKQFLTLREAVGWKGNELQAEKALESGLYKNPLYSKFNLNK